MHRLLLRLSIFCLCFPSFLFAYGDFETKIPTTASQSLAATDGLPSNLVCNCVCTITGEYVDSQTDIALPGPEPLIIQRNYSSYQDAGNFGGPWSLNHGGSIIAGYQDEHLRRSPTLLLNLPTGSRLLYAYLAPKEELKFEKLAKVQFQPEYPKGLTNGARGQLGGGGNIKNQKVYCYPKQERVEVVSGSGDVRVFKKFKRNQSHGHNVCFQTEENKRNGNSIIYERGGSDDLAKIYAINRKTKLPYSWILFEKHPKHTKDHPIMTLETSDHKHVTYYFSKHAHKRGDLRYSTYNMTKIESSQRPSQSYEYGKRSDFEHYHIKAKKLPEDRFLKIAYYMPGDNVLGPLGNIHVPNEDYRLDRVKSLQAPVGTDSTPITTHYFLYQVSQKKHKDGTKEILEGQTEVFNALLHKVVYHYDKEHHLIKKERFRGVFPNYSLDSFEGYLWGAKGSDQEGNLIGKYLKGADGNIHSVRNFTYDSAGNLESDSLCGSLTGKDSPAICLNARGHPIQHGYEVYKKKYTYSKDGLNLLLSEEEPNGKKTLYDYDPQTGLLKFKLVVYKEKIHLRTTYEYNENGVLTCEIVDDGSSIRPHNLENVTERRIKRITARKVAPFNLPEQVDELFFNFATGKEELIKRFIYHYSQDGHLEQQDLFDSEGIYRYSLQWSYDAHGNVTKETSALGEVTTYLYDANDNKIFQQGPAFDHSIHYTYDYSNRLIQEEEMLPNGKSLVTSHSYDHLGNKIATIDPYGQKTTYDYDELGRLIKTGLPPLLQEDGSLSIPTIHKKYDVAGFVCCEEDALGNKIEKKNNIRGQPIHIQYPDGAVEKFFYELDGSLAQKVEKNGKIIRYTRDFLGRVTKEEIVSSNGEVLKTQTFKYNSFHLLKSVDPEGLKTEYTYDLAGRLISLIKGDQHLVQTYDCLGRVSTIQEWYGQDSSQVRINKKEYDLKDRITEDRIETKEGTILSLARYNYDVFGNQTLQQKGEVITRILYDTHKRPVKITDALGRETHIVYKHRHKNEVGQRVLKTIKTDSLGAQTIEIYNTQGSIHEVIKQNAAGVILSHLKIWYDLNGNQKQTTNIVYLEGKQTRSIHNKWQYNAMNQPVTLIEAANTQEQKVTRYYYNQQGQQCRLIKSSGVEIHSIYNEEGLLHRYKSLDGTIDYEYEYSKGDLPVVVKDLITGLTTERSYDRMGQLRVEKLANGLTLSYTHDLVGRMTGITLPDGSKVAYKYDETHLKTIERIQNNQITYSYDVLKHNLSGSALSCQGIGKQSFSYRYDALGRLVQLELPNFKQTIPDNGYDAVGNLICYKDTKNEDSIDHHFSYDGLYQLTSESGYEDHNYAYDSASGRIKKDNMQCSINALNQILEQGEEKFFYTPNGSLQRCVSPNGKEILYEYDALDRLVKVTKEGTVIHYIYDAFNRRVIQRQNGKDTLFLYQGQHEIGVVQDNQIKQLKVIYPGDISKSIAIELNNTVYEPIHDLFGHTVRLLNLEGELIEQYSYSAFGEETIQDRDGNIIESSQAINPWRYADKRTDIETGFIAFGLRYYSPKTGSWVTPDPLGYKDGPNLYAYVHANPLIYFDALGLFSMPFSPIVNANQFIYSDDLGSNSIPFSPINNSNILSHPNIDYSGILSTPDPGHEKLGFWDRIIHSDGKTKNYNLNDDFVDLQTKNPFCLKLSNRLRIQFTNGIDNSFFDFRDALLYIQKFSQGFNVYGTYTPTKGILGDAYRYIATTFFKIGFQAVHKLHESWYDFFKNAHSDAVLLQICHSWGAANVRDALMSFPEELRKRISVIAIAPGAYIDRDLCKDVVHYVCLQDLVPRLDMCGWAMAGGQGTVQYLGDFKANLSFSDGKHAFKSEIYEPYLNLGINNYLNQNH